jgi:MoaA/NifB/PqqE/SkfB family radical SAM enzyme
MDYTALKAQNQALNSEEVLSRRIRLQSKPVFFSLELCGPCNLKCAHCGFQVFGRTSDQQISEEVYAAIISELMPTAYLCHLGGGNWGEMTIAKNFHRFLLDAQKFGVRINLTTNGTRMLAPWFDDLLDTLAVIGFSMEGMHDEFEKVRGFRWQHCKCSPSIRSYAAGSMGWLRASNVGSRDGAGSPQSAASQAAVT